MPTREKLAAYGWGLALGAGSIMLATILLVGEPDQDGRPCTAELRWTPTPGTVVRKAHT